MKCKIRDKNDNKWIEYTTPIYTKLNGVYGYLSVSMLTVNFFWVNFDSYEINFDDVTDRFEIEYIIS